MERSPITAVTAFRARKLPGGGPSYRLDYDGALYFDIIARYVDDLQSISRSNTVHHIWTSDVIALYAHCRLICDHQNRMNMHTFHTTTFKTSTRSLPVSIRLDRPRNATQDLLDGGSFEVCLCCRLTRPFTGSMTFCRAPMMNELPTRGFSVRISTFSILAAL